MFAMIGIPFAIASFSYGAAIEGRAARPPHRATWREAWRALRRAA